MTSTKWTPEYIKEYHHNHYINNKEKYIQSAIKNHWNDMIYCEHCDKEYKKKHYDRHIKSKMHLFNMEYGNKHIITCKICNSTFSRNGLNRHNSSIMHIQNSKLI